MSASVCRIQNPFYFYTDEVKHECADYRNCAEVKPHFFRPPHGALIKPTQSMKRLSTDFKGPVLQKVQVLLGSRS